MTPGTRPVRLDQDGRWAEERLPTLEEFNRLSRSLEAKYTPILIKLPPWELTALADALADELAMRHRQLQTRRQVPRGLPNRLVYGDHSRKGARV